MISRKDCGNRTGVSAAICQYLRTHESGTSRQIAEAIGFDPQTVSAILRQRQLAGELGIRSNTRDRGDRCAYVYYLRRQQAST